MCGWLDPLRFAVCLAFLSIASVHDVKTREVPNLIWVVFAPVGLALTLASLALSGWSQTFMLTWLITAAITAGLSTALFYLGLFGGADAKALICLAISMPTHPSMAEIKPALELPAYSALKLPPPISAFNNAVLMASLLAVVIAVRNLIDLAANGRRIFEGLEKERLITKAFALITGFRVDAEKIRSGKHHYILLEEFSRSENGAIKRRLKVLQRLNMEEESESGSNIPEEFNGKIWVTIGLPFLVFITVGFATAVLAGDIIFWLVEATIQKTLT
ncbi:MAG: A24 family peptidase C-terminal domain-containing protein [Candidatus Bathyarchaeia archaeon]